MENSENEEQGSSTPPITVEFTGNSLPTITNLSELAVGNTN